MHVLKLLFLTFYYRPDLCAGSFRATSLVEALLEEAPADWQIDVVTTLPNRYDSFTADAPRTHTEDRLSIWRIPLPKHQSGMLGQSKAFLMFSRAVRKRVAREHYDLVVATSSRLMTAVLATEIAWRKKAKLYLDIRDIFVDTIQDVLPSAAAWIVKPVFSILEQLAVRRADKVNLISPGFAEYFHKRYPRKQFSYFTNGIDDEFLSAAGTLAFEGAPRHASQRLTVLYAGNVGEGQGLHEIVPALAKRTKSRLHFKIIGDGGRKPALQAALSRLDVSNVELLPPVDRTELIDAYLAADVLFVHLNHYDAFKKVLPSKIFEYAALGKPVWAGVAGYAAEFIRAEITNAAVFQPCDVEDAVRSFETLSLRDAPRAGFAAKYARLAINRAMAADIIDGMRV